MRRSWTWLRGALVVSVVALGCVGCGKEEPPSDNSVTPDSGTDAGDDMAGADLGMPDSGDDDTGALPTCGDGVIDDGESCDGAELGGANCGDLDLPDGELTCAADCTLDTSGCAVCDDGVCSDGESPTSCPADCAVVDVAAGARHSCAVLADGSVWCWGARAGHHMGGVDDVNEPVRLSGIDDVLEVVAGDQHTCVRTEDDVLCWGANGYGQAGAEISHEVFSPVSVGSGTALHAGAFHTCVKRSPLSTECFGRVGWQPKTIDAPLELPGNGLIAAGRHHTCFTDQVHLYCIGRGDRGQRGIGDTTWRDEYTPFEDRILFNAFYTSLGVGGEHACVTFGPGAAQPGLYCWGANDFGQHGVRPGEDALEPQFISSIIPQQLDGGLRHTCATVFDGESPLICWGDNARGQLGTGVTTAEYQFEQLEIVVRDFDVGNRHTCAAMADGTARCWGDNADGQVGDGSTDMIVPTPTPPTRFAEEQP